MNFFWISFALNQKYRAANFFRPIQQNQAENKPPQKTVQKSLSQRKIIKNYIVLKKKPFNAISFDKHRKTTEANKK